MIYGCHRDSCICTTDCKGWEKGEKRTNKNRRDETADCIHVGVAWQV